MTEMVEFLDMNKKGTNKPINKITCRLSLYEMQRIALSEAVYIIRTLLPM